MYTRLIAYLVFFFFNDTATTEIYTLSLHTLFRSLHPRGIDAEFIAGSAIMIRIQEQPDHVGGREVVAPGEHRDEDRKSTRLNSSHGYISYAVFCLKKKKFIDPIPLCYIHRDVREA